jgi:hypothetical protein
VGPDEAFREFFVAQYGPLRRLGFLLTGSWDAGDELAEEALVRAHPRPAGLARRPHLARQHRHGRGADHHRDLAERAPGCRARANLRRPAVAVAALGEDRLVPWVLVEVPRPASSLSAPVRTAPGRVATLDFDAGRGHVLMQLVRPADPLVPVPLFRWDRHGAPKRIPVAAGVTNAQW